MELVARSSELHKNIQLHNTLIEVVLDPESEVYASMASEEWKKIW